MLIFLHASSGLKITYIFSLLWWKLKRYNELYSLYEKKQVYNEPRVFKFIAAIKTRQLYNGPQVVKFISAIWK